jgi:glycosyltransferase involved in cell wall biosynthesis
MPRTRFLFVGSGPLEASLREQASRLGVAGELTITAWPEDTHEVVNAFDLCCHPSITEGFSNALLECLAVEKPVVACRTGGNPELIEDNDNGYLVPPGDSAALAEKIIFLGQHADFCRIMGESGRKRVLADFTSEKMARSHEDFYFRLWNARKK